VTKGRRYDFFFNLLPRHFTRVLRYNFYSKSDATGSLYYAIWSGHVAIVISRKIKVY